MTSWDSYLDNLVSQSKDGAGCAHVDKAVIVALDGGAKWTSDGHARAFKLSQAECAAIARCFKARDFAAFESGGVRCEGCSYLFLREEEGGKVALGRLKGHGAVSMRASKTAVVIGHCPEGCQLGSTNKAVGVVADYLESVNL